MLEILIDARVSGVDVIAVGPNGTARDMLKARRDYSQTLHETFEALVLSIRPVWEETRDITGQEPGSRGPLDIIHEEQILEVGTTEEMDEFWDAEEEISEEVIPAGKEEEKEEEAFRDTVERFGRT